MKRFHMTLVSGVIDYALLEYDEEEYKEARYVDDKSFKTIEDGIGNTIILRYSYAEREKTYLNIGYTSLGNLSVTSNTHQFFDDFKPCKTKEVVNVRIISECIEKEKIVQQISIAIASLQKMPKSPYRDCMEKYYTDMKKFVESVEVDE